MKTAITEPGYIETSIVRKISISVESMLMGIFQREKGREAETCDLEAKIVSGKKKRSSSLDDYAGAIDQLAKFRAGATI